MYACKLMNDGPGFDHHFISLFSAIRWRAIDSVFAKESLLFYHITHHYYINNNDNIS